MRRLRSGAPSVHHTGPRSPRASLAACTRAFAAATAILAKVGIDGVAPDVATFIRTLVVVALAGAILAERDNIAGYLAAIGVATALSGGADDS